MHTMEFLLLSRLRDPGAELRIRRAEDGTHVAQVAQTGNVGRGEIVETRHALAIVHAGHAESVGKSSPDWDVYRMSAIGRGKSDPQHREQKIIGTCALRFDGYEYLEEASSGGRESLDGGETTFDLEEETGRFFTKPDYTMPLDYLCTMLFFIQRSQMREGWLRWDSQLARIARRLFVLTCNYEVPARFRHEEWAAKWDRKYAPCTADLIRFIEERAAATVYRDEIF